jgi:hypothetical protein
VRLKTEEGCTLCAAHLVLATGYESQEFLPRKVALLKSTFAIASEPVSAFPGWWRRCLLWETARPYLYLRTTPDRRILVGGDDVSFRDGDRRDRLVASKADHLVERFRKLFPQIPLKVDYRWAGTFGETRWPRLYRSNSPKCRVAILPSASAAMGSPTASLPRKSLPARWLDAVIRMLICSPSTGEDGDFCGRIAMRVASGLNRDTVRARMPKSPRKKDSDYLRFRPYRAFTEQPTNNSSADRWTLFWRIVIALGALALVFFAALSLIRR